MIYVLYLLLAACIVFLSIKLANYVDLLDKKTKISGAFIGGVLLAAVTSLPELFTSISATILIHQKELVIGNIIGSNLFNFLILGLTILLFIKKWRQATLNVSHLYLLFIIFGMCLITLYAILIPVKYQPILGPINLLNILIIGLYILSLKLQPKEGENEQADDSPLTIKQIVIRFIISAILLVGTSIAITYATDAVAQKLNLSATVAGSLFLAIATSLPELISTITLCKKGNFDAGLGNIIGSNVFNFFILGLSEFLSYDGTIFIYRSSETFLLTMLLIISLLLVMIILLMHNLIRPKVKTQKSILLYNTFSMLCGIGLIASYVLFLLLNNRFQL